MDVEDGGVYALLYVFFDLVEALGDLLGAGAQGGDGPGGAVEVMAVKALRLAFMSSQP